LWLGDFLLWQLGEAICTRKVRDVWSVICCCGYRDDDHQFDRNLPWTNYIFYILIYSFHYLSMVALLLLYRNNKSTEAAPEDHARVPIISLIKKFTFLFASHLWIQSLVKSTSTNSTQLREDIKKYLPHHPLEKYSINELQQIHLTLRKEGVRLPTFELIMSVALVPAFLPFSLPNLYELICNEIAAFLVIGLVLHMLRVYMLAIMHDFNLQKWPTFIAGYCFCEFSHGVHIRHI